MRSRIQPQWRIEDRLNNSLRTLPGQGWTQPRGIGRPSNKELKLTTVRPSFARAPGTSGALTLAA